jgi:hypothetical protein
MKNKLMPMLDKLLLRKRALIECVNDQLKNISQIEHTRHRSAVNRNGQHPRRRGGLYLSTEEASLGPVGETRQPGPTTPVSQHDGLALGRIHVI